MLWLSQAQGLDYNTIYKLLSKWMTALAAMSAKIIYSTF